MAFTTTHRDATFPAGRPHASRTIRRASGLGHDFETFASTLRRAVVPASPLENVLTDRLILAAWRLQVASVVEFDTALAGDDLPPASRDALDAERSLERALELLETSRAARLGLDTRPEPSDADLDAHDAVAFGPADSANEWPTLPDDAETLADADDDDAPDGRGEDDQADLPRWQDRLVFDESVSESSPVVKGTWVTVSHVVSLIVDGWTWNDVLRAHPELTEDDIRTCLAYTVEQDNRGEF